MPTSGGSATTLFSGPFGPYGLVVDATNVYWNTASGNGNGTVTKVPTQGGAPTTLASQQNDPVWGIAVDGTSVYWTNVADGTVMKLTPK